MFSCKNIQDYVLWNCEALDFDANDENKLSWSCPTIFCLMQYPVLQRIDGISVETMLFLWSMKERYKPSSKYKMYFEMLPEEFNTGMHFPICIF